MDEHSMDASPLASRIGAGIVTMLVAAFALGAMFMFLAPLDAADAVSGHRDDGAEECDSSGPGDGDCDDEDDTTITTTSHSAATQTGTTQGTGASQTVSESRDERSANTHTGSTQGTGQSNSVSNSS